MNFALATSSGQARCLVDRTATELAAAAKWASSSLRTAGAVHLVVEVNAFQWNVRPRWGRNFWKSVRCCVQLVFSMFVFSPIDGLSWVFHGYHADGCSYSLVFWEFCTSLVARSVVQDSYKHRRILAYHFNLLMYFLALRIGTRRLPVIGT